MQMIKSILFAAMTFTSFACSNPAEDNSELSMTHLDNRAQIQFYNRCDHDVTYGLMGKGDISKLRPFERRDYELGTDDAYYPALAFYGYRPGEHPGFGHMTLAEFTLNTSFQKMDFYDVSAVDGYNIGMKITNGGYSCREAICGGAVRETCPQSQRIVRNGVVIACTKFGDRDNPNNPAAQHFERMCANAYSWSKDDSATVGCTAQDYIVTFCPYR